MQVDYRVLRPTLKVCQYDALGNGREFVSQAFKTFAFGPEPAGGDRCNELPELKVKKLVATNRVFVPFSDAPQNYPVCWEDGFYPEQN